MVELVGRLTGLGNALEGDGRKTRVAPPVRNRRDGMRYGAGVSANGAVTGTPQLPLGLPGSPREASRLEGHSAGGVPAR